MFSTFPDTTRSGRPRHSGLSRRQRPQWYQKVLSRDEVDRWHNKPGWRPGARNMDLQFSSCTSCPPCGFVFDLHRIITPCLGVLARPGRKETHDKLKKHSTRRTRGTGGPEQKSIGHSWFLALRPFHLSRRLGQPHIDGLRPVIQGKRGWPQPTLARVFNGTFMCSTSRPKCMSFLCVLFGTAAGRLTSRLTRAQSGTI